MSENMGYADLFAYKKAFLLSMDIFRISKAFPKEEIYALTSQIRRSSRGVCGNIAEAYRKRMYPKHFISKLTDADGECSETEVWIEYALQCEYIDHATYKKLLKGYQEVGKLLGTMINKPYLFT